MKMPDSLSPVLKIAQYTVADEMRQRSLIVMFLMCALGVFFTRGCYQGQYLINGQLLEGAAIIRQISTITFHLIAAGAMFITALMTMRAFRSDRDGGMQSCILSKPIGRRQYLAGKILGFWSLACIFMLILHTLVCVIASFNMHQFLPAYLAASLLCSINLLFTVLAVMLFSLFLPDIIAFLSVLGIVTIGGIADLFYKISHVPLMRPQAVGTAPTELTWGKLIYYLWPKLSATEQWAASWLEITDLPRLNLYPLCNVLLYCLVLILMLIRRFREEEIV